MELTRKGIEQEREGFAKAGYLLPEFDYEKVAARTMQEPVWLHFGTGNIFRAFQANVVQKLLNSGVMDRGLIAAGGSNPEIIEKVYRPHENLSVLVTLKADGTVEKTVIGSIVESLVTGSFCKKDFARMKEIFCAPSLQMISFTITEKGYNLQNADGSFRPVVEQDMERGPAEPVSYMGIVTAMLYERYCHGRHPLACVSMDNCSHNGDVLKHSVMTIAEAWVRNGLAEEGFSAWLDDNGCVSFPCTMIDKITPRPDSKVEALIAEDGIDGLEQIVTSKGTYASVFVNAEECEYLVIEDSFPNGRPPLEKGGVIFTDRGTVDKTEKMKVGTCLNPLHTALAVFGCLLGYERISEEMENPVLRRLAERIGYQEGMPVVVNPGILSPEHFLDEVLRLRIPNPFMPDTPQRIATDTSQKLSVRFGETVRSYLASDTLEVSELRMIPLVYAGWLRYLMAVDDKGKPFALSPDPLLEMLCAHMEGLKPGKNENVGERLRPVLENQAIFGVDLYQAGLAEQVLRYFEELSAGPGAVARTLEYYVMEEKTNMKTIEEQFAEYGVVPVVVLDDAKDAQPLADALCAGGLAWAGVTFRTAAAEESIRRMSASHPKMLVGAGTVLTKEQVERAVGAGAKFIVSPGFDPDIVDFCLEKGIPVFPGCITPSEVAQAVKRGLKVVKFFPAEQFGGVKTIKAIAAPYTMVKFMPTGGINAGNLKEYLSCDRIVCCGGSWMVKKELVQAGAFEKICELTKEAVAMVKELRG